MDSNWEEDLGEAKKGLLACERLFYVGLTILKDNRILAKMIRELARVLIKTINAYIGYYKFQGLLKRELDFSDKLEIFFKKIAPKYICSEDKDRLLKILLVAKVHKSSELEFVREERLVMYYQGRYESIGREKVLEYSKAIGRLIGAFPLKKA